jgi:hypothetical protein
MMRPVLKRRQHVEVMWLRRHLFVMLLLYTVYVLGPTWDNRSIWFGSDALLQDQLLNSCESA